MPLWRQICFLNHVIRSLLIICRCFSFVLTQEEFAQSGTELLQLSWGTNGTQLLQIWDPAEVWVLLRWSLKTELLLLFPCLTLNGNCLHRTGTSSGGQPGKVGSDRLYSGLMLRLFCVQWGNAGGSIVLHLFVLILFCILFHMWCSNSRSFESLRCYPVVTFRIFLLGPDVSGLKLSALWY